LVLARAAAAEIRCSINGGIFVCTATKCGAGGHNLQVHGIASDVIALVAVRAGTREAEHALARYLKLLVMHTLPVQAQRASVHACGR